MCGIVGMVRDRDSIDASLLGEMAASLAHRGPDGVGHVLGPTRIVGQPPPNTIRTSPQRPDEGLAWALGHRRLSIIDLVSGDQPMRSEDETLWIVFNGEIYNFRELRAALEQAGCTFRTQSDTEVILHAYDVYGEQCVERFNGIFSFAIWDRRDGSLFIARDHLGVKPLYYVERDDGLSFASEVRALLLDPTTPRAVDLSALDMFLAFRYVPSPHTMFRGVRKLPPGHCMRWTRQGLNIRRYWHAVPTIAATAERDLLDAYRDKFDATVRRQMVSDVPIGALLSGGIDSASVAASMQAASDEPIRTFTVGFEGDVEANELDEARAFAQRLGTDHHEVVISADDYAAELERSVRMLEEPITTTSALALYFVCELARDNGVKVVLTGQGADEVLGGYHRYRGEKLGHIYRRLPRWLRSGVIRPVIEHGFRSRRVQRGARALWIDDDLERFLDIYAVFPASERAGLYRPEVAAQIAAADSAAPLRSLHDEAQHLDSLAKMLYMDTRMWLPDELLMCCDKMSMAASIEARVPFLDVEFVEFVESIPSRLKVRTSSGKHIHKRAMASRLPREIIQRKKKGFPAPMDQWLRQELRPYASDMLLAPDSACAEFFTRSHIEALLNRHGAGADLQREIFTLLTFELWHRTFLRQG